MRKDVPEIKRNNASKTPYTDETGNFAKGNPGRPKGARNKATVAVLGLLNGQAEELTQAAISRALEGDSTALRLCMERIAPPPKDQPVQFDLPTIDTADEAAGGARAVLAAVSNGTLTPHEASSVMALIDQFRRTLELTELEKRVSNLEMKSA
ncbi:hypothetical protein [uncultured Litoreibacter sp.]|uniref:hypothetical protein n=1 Tax=uncultured Litoreibacter sp. TaxID=1392394 RepID=UPI00260FA0D7|nr:hypothetical protein [uncultured Litoreibacter sp.]